MELSQMGTAPTVATMDSPADNRLRWSDAIDLYSLVPYPEDHWNRAGSRRCFNPDESMVQIALTDVTGENRTTVRHLGSWAELRAYSSHSSIQPDGLRIISINQRNSWRPLNVTRSVLQEIINLTSASSEFLEYTLAFCQKSLAVEEAFSSAPLFKFNDRFIETAYVFKYACCKSVDDKRDPWVIRQTAVYHKYDIHNRHATCIFLNPTPDCLFQTRLTQLLQSPNHCATFRQQPLLFHSVLFGTFFPLWRDYLAFYEDKILTISNTNMAQRIEEELRVNHETLGSVRYTENRCLPLQPIFRAFEKTVQILHRANNVLADCGVTQQPEEHALKQLLDNYMNMADAYTQNALFLQNRTARMAHSLTDTLSFKDSDTAKKQSQYMLDLTLSTVDDSTTVRAITIVTLIYLPSTFMATLLGMNSFFEMNSDNHNLVVSPQFWIYVVCSVPLTAATLLSWWVFQRSRQRLKMQNKEANML